MGLHSTFLYAMLLTLKSALCVQGAQDERPVSDACTWGLVVESLQGLPFPRWDRDVNIPP